MAKIGIFLELISINAQTITITFRKRVWAALPESYIFPSVGTFLASLAHRPERKKWILFFSASIQDKLLFHVFIGCWFKKKGSKKLETFIYYVVGHSVMKQLLDESRRERKNGQTINIFHVSTKDDSRWGEAKRLAINGGEINLYSQHNHYQWVSNKVRIISISSIASVLNLLKSLQTNKLICSPIKLYGLHWIALKHH